ncbi:Hypothetical_protein [Hexamita inflata]|uniref:Hypothetical_protein n=1 Tax=Hexamita inflata TaxID=28002 RepID=A0AA86TIN1_9EUKA|nr:Hypothetical protein HINF_LOCUS4727 [Hexamita inflata]
MICAWSQFRPRAPSSSSQLMQLCTRANWSWLPIFFTQALFRISSSAQYSWRLRLGEMNMTSRVFTKVQKCASSNWPRGCFCATFGLVQATSLWTNAGFRYWPKRRNAFSALVLK